MFDFSQEHMFDLSGRASNRRSKRSRSVAALCPWVQQGEPEFGGQIVFGGGEGRPGPRVREAAGSIGF